MGTFIEESVVVTTNTVNMEAVLHECEKLALPLCLAPEGNNGLSQVFIPSSGSKLGWEPQRHHGKCIDQLILSLMEYDNLGITLMRIKHGECRTEVTEHYL